MRTAEVIIISLSQDNIDKIAPSIHNKSIIHFYNQEKYFDNIIILRYFCREMGMKEKQIILFFTVAIASGLLFLSLNRFNLYQKYIQISDRSRRKNSSYIKNLPQIPDNKKRTSDITQKININHADVNMLITLPGVGRETALNIIDYRTKIGDFKEVEELLYVKGIGVKKLEIIKKHIYIE